MNTSVPQQGLLDTVAQKSGLQGFMQKLNISQAMLIEIGVYLGVGFVAGFLLKRFSKAILAIVLGLLLLWFLHHMGIVLVIVQWSRLQEMIFGTPSLLTPQTDLGSMMWQWITTHIAGTISFIIGFLAGIRLG